MSDNHLLGRPRQRSGERAFFNISSGVPTPPWPPLYRGTPAAKSPALLRVGPLTGGPDVRCRFKKRKEMPMSDVSAA